MSDCSIGKKCNACPTVIKSYFSFSEISITSDTSIQTLTDQLICRNFSLAQRPALIIFQLISIPLLSLNEGANQNSSCPVPVAISRYLLLVLSELRHLEMSCFGQRGRNLSQFIPWVVNPKISIVRIISIIKLSSMIKQKKQKEERKELLEGVSRKIKRDLEDIIQSLDNDYRHKGQIMRDQFKKITAQIQQIAGITNRCYHQWIGETYPISTNKRNPFVLLKYTRFFMEALIQIKEEQLKEKRQKKKENQIAINSYNSNNVYELIAKKNIEFLDMNNLIKDLKIQKSLTDKKAAIAEQMTQAVQVQAQQLLKAYRENFSKITELLRKAEEKQTQLLQSNRFLNEQITNLTQQYNNYRMNFKQKQPNCQNQKRLRERLQKEYQQRNKLTMKQLENQLKAMYKVR